MILTTVDQVFLNYGKENETPIDHMTVEEARKAIVAGQFEEATMQPKIVAGVEFVSKKPGRKAIITSIDRQETVFSEKQEQSSNDVEKRKTPGAHPGVSFL